MERRKGYGRRKGMSRRKSGRVRQKVVGKGGEWDGNGSGKRHGRREPMRTPGLTSENVLMTFFKKYFWPFPPKFLLFSLPNFLMTFLIIYT